MSSLPRIPTDCDLAELEDAGPPESWPDWTDSWHWTPDPLPSDAAWAAEEFADADDQADEFAALESAALDAIERSLIPADLALAINRTSLAGSDATADAILHSGSDERFCSCEPCVWERTRRYAD